jgi:hypothetical protein
MNVTKVEADDAMSVLSSVSSDGVAAWDWDADENGTAAALLGKACDVLFDCTTITCGCWVADL